MPFQRYAGATKEKTQKRHEKEKKKKHRVRGVVTTVVLDNSPITIITIVQPEPVRSSSPLRTYRVPDPGPPSRLRIRTLTVAVAVVAVDLLPSCLPPLHLHLHRRRLVQIASSALPPETHPTERPLSPSRSALNSSLESNKTSSRQYPEREPWVRYQTMD